jgi:hypothetical protein
MRAPRRRRPAPAPAPRRRQDDAKLKALSLEVERLTQEAAARAEQLGAEVAETQAAQVQLDRTAEDYRRLHAERAALAAQWDAAAAAAARRDEAIVAAGAEFAARRATLWRRKAALDGRAAALEAEEAAQRELEARVAHYEKELVGRPRGWGLWASVAGVEGFEKVGCCGKNRLPARAAPPATRAHVSPRRPQAVQREAHRAESAKLTELTHEVGARGTRRQRERVLRCAGAQPALAGGRRCIPCRSPARPLLLLRCPLH